MTSERSLPRREPRSPYFDVVPVRLNIFVPALMSVGFVFWLGALVRDQLRRRRESSLERRAAIAGANAAAITVGRRPDEDLVETLSSNRRSHVLIACSLVALAVYVMVGAIANYLRPGGYVSEIGWLLAISALLGISFAAGGAVLLLVVTQWPHLSPGLRRLATRTPIVRPPRDADGFAEPSQELNIALVATAGAATLVAMVVGSSRGMLSNLDDPLLDAAADAGWLSHIAGIDLLGSSSFVIVAAALLGLASLRCRVLVAAYPAAIVAAFLTSNLLKSLVERERPAGGLFGGEFDSFPSGHIVMTTVLVGLLPLTASVMLHSTRHTRPLRWLSVVAVIIAALHRVHDEAHWPTDVIGAVLIGAAIVLAVEWAIAHEAWHQRCSSCPWTPHRGQHVIHSTVPMHVDVARLLGWGSHAAAAGVAILLAVLATTRGIPADPEGVLLDPAIQRALQLGLAGFVSVGTLVSWRWPQVGALMLAFAAGGLGTFAALQYEPLIALAMTGVVLVPAVLLWLSWQHKRRHHEIALLAVTTLVVLIATWFTASIVYASLFGPTHESSDAERLPVDHVEWVWLGALGPESISVTARFDNTDANARVIATSGEQVWMTPLQQPTENGIARFDLSGLGSDRSYDYFIEVDGEADAGRGVGTFRTPAAGPASFRLVAASCARVDSNAAVFDSIAAEDPLLYLALGDVHYSNIAENDTETFRVAYDRMLTQPGQAALYQDVPVAYVWDDHDYGPNDSDATSPSREAAREAFRENVPSHELISAEGAIHRAFSIGRVRFIVTDTRSERQGETMLGEKQLAWFEEELRTASESHALVVWMNPTPWIGAAAEGGDGWAAFADERRHIADALADASVDNLLMVSGDAHMLAFDDGTNSGYATDGSPGFPILHAAALDRPGNVKGGPYSGGTYPGFGQYGVIDIADDGDEVVVELTGKNWKGDVLFSERLQFSN